MYYTNKIDSLKRIFKSEMISLDDSHLRVGDVVYPIIDDVIIALDQNQYTSYLKQLLESNVSMNMYNNFFADDIQFTFGEEWKEYNSILPEHHAEFSRYFDLINLQDYKQKTVCDLGCGNGRWSYYMADYCREIILVDFSDAIFTARKNLQEKDGCIFIMADIKQLPFRENFVDFLFCIGVLHHLPTPCLDEVCVLKKFAPELLIYLYYALDNRPWYFRYFLSIITPIRRVLSLFRNEYMRHFISVLGAYLLYLPLVQLGRLFQFIFGRGSMVPLYEGYCDKSVKRIEQDVYDRFFTRIEQRVSKVQIEDLKEIFSTVLVSPQEPYWHFVCRR